MNASGGRRERSYNSQKREEFGNRNGQGVSHHGGSYGNQTHMNNARSANLDRIFWAFASCIGKKVVVQLKDGQCWEGIFHANHLISSSSSENVVANNPNKKYGIVLKMAYKLPKGDSSRPDNLQQPCPILTITDNEFESMKARMADASPRPSSSGTFMTDSEISRPGGASYLDGRKLQSCEYLLDDGSLIGTLEEISEVNGDQKPFDQFEVNRRKFGISSTFDEAIYTTPLDKESDFYKANEADAERVAREIESANTKNAHLAEERGQKIEDDCEEKYTATPSHHFKSRNSNGNHHHHHSSFNDNSSKNNNGSGRNAVYHHSNVSVASSDHYTYVASNPLHPNAKQDLDSTTRHVDQQAPATTTILSDASKKESEKSKSSYDFNRRNLDKSSKPHLNSSPGKQAPSISGSDSVSNDAKVDGEGKISSNDHIVSGNNNYRGSNATAARDASNRKQNGTPAMKKKLNPNAAEFRYGAGVLGLIDSPNLQNRLNEMQLPLPVQQPYFNQSQSFNLASTNMPWIHPGSVPMPATSQSVQIYTNIIIPASLEKLGMETAGSQAAPISWGDTISACNTEPLTDIYDRAFGRIVYHHVAFQESWNEQTQPMIGNFKPFSEYYDPQYLQSPYVQCYPQGPYYDYYKIGVRRPC